jgi:twitching motility protein PilT
MNPRTGIKEILKTAIEKDASDIHLKVGSPPVFRIHRELNAEKSFPVLEAVEILDYFKEIASEEQKKTFFKNWDLDFSYTQPELGRFRVNIYMQTGTPGIIFRWVRSKVPTIEELGLPPVCKELAMKREGMVILTGPTGCGKSTTLAAMLNHMNHSLKRNIITIEDPIEFLHTDDMCTFSQREVGVDTHNFAEALKHIFRQDPDVILIGEMRDLETMAIALTAAETGHLILTTLHTPSSYEAIDRFVDAFPSAQHQQVRLQISTTLQGVLYQNLVPRADKKGLVPAVEVLTATPAIRNLIREGKSFQMLNFMHTGQDAGMQTLDQSLLELYRSGKISQSEVISRLRSSESLLKSNGKKGNGAPGGKDYGIPEGIYID